MVLDDISKHLDSCGEEYPQFAGVIMKTTGRQK